MQEKTLDIGTVAKRSGLAPSTLRYYEQKGLINSVSRKGLRRQFDSSVLEKLMLISLGRIANLSLDEIASMFGNKGEVNINRDKLISKADEIEQTITQLQATRDGLRHVANCTAPSHLECPRFNKIMRIALKKHTD